MGAPRVPEEGGGRAAQQPTDNRGDSTPRIFLARRSPGRSWELTEAGGLSGHQVFCIQLYYVLQLERLNVARGERRKVFPASPDRRGIGIRVDGDAALRGAGTWTPAQRDLFGSGVYLPADGLGVFQYLMVDGGWWGNAVEDTSRGGTSPPTPRR